MTGSNLAANLTRTAEQHADRRTTMLEPGEEVSAYVVLAPGAETSAEQMIEHLRAQVAPDKYPRTVHLIEELPQGATGKILERELRTR